MKYINTLLISLFCTIQPVLADEAITANIKYALKRTMDNNYVSVVIALCIVIVLIYVTGIIYAKLNVLGYKTLKKEYKDLDESKIIILSTTQLGSNKSLHVIELAGKKMLIGVTNDNISLLKDLSIKDVNLSSNDSEMDRALSNSTPLDDLYSNEKEEYKNEDVQIENKIPEEKSSEDDSLYDSEEYGLYKKYLQ